MSSAIMADDSSALVKHNVKPPCYRHADGDLVPAVVLPVELENAVARAVLERAGARAMVSIHLS